MTSVQPSSKKVILIIATLTSFMSPFMMSGVNIALPAIQEEFSASAVLLSWIATSYLLATSVFLVPMGRIADIKGRKKFLTYGIAIFTLTTFLSTFIPSIQILIVLRVFQGIGGAMMMTTGIAVLLILYPPSERGKVLGINVASVYTGLSIGPFVGGVLTQYLGWRSIFLATTPIGLLILYLIIMKLPGEWADAEEESLDLSGSTLYSVSLVAFMYGVSHLSNRFASVLVLGGVLGLIFFVRHEMKVKHPVFEVNLFLRNRVFAFSNLAALIHYSATFAVMFLLSLYLQSIRGISPQKAGLILLCQPVLQALISPYAGKLSDRRDPGRIASLGMAITGLGLFLLIFLRPDSSLISITSTLSLLGFGYGLFSSPNMNAIMSSVERQYYGIAAGTVSTMRSVGMTLSMTIATLIFSFHIGKAMITSENQEAFMESVRISLILFCVLCGVGVFCSLVRGKLRKV